ncbi:RluA family pseudouridine synthase [Lachnoanaerobaculum saburreum]|uniref:Pseudouridine synthase n=1 Tax=Lachnoanaerobaculum saburreum TaxID=467210 RepID=A0A133ZIV8_9FIRM|nr:RluA family pseudouridine synthase [Lachnoanaerobaculum saburreum]KXB55365.1 pseudouridine synthase, RluA family [Lachnoanaerobaculum saburreum]
MERQILYIIDKDYKSISDFLKSKGYTSSNIVELKKYENGIVLNGTWAYMNQKPAILDRLLVRVCEYKKSENILPVFIKLDIKYEDEDIVVVNKPSDMPIHPSLNNYENSMANALMYYCRDKNFVFRCINRLDRDTTGLSVVAKHFLSAGILNTFMQRREIKRVYNAIVEDDGSLKESGTVDAPIAREDDTLIKRRVSKEGQRAITNYKVLKRLNGASLIELRLDTGRTHQIRVHMSYIGHPLVGDYLYNERCYDKENVRPLLHSKSLSFIHPITGEDLYLECELPKDFKERIDEYV